MNGCLEEAQQLNFYCKKHGTEIKLKSSYCVKVSREVAEELSFLNADISLLFIGLKKRPTVSAMVEINKRIGLAVRKLRGEVK